MKKREAVAIHFQSYYTHGELDIKHPIDTYPNR